MKRKISSFITAMFVLFVCLIATACGDKYKDLQFEVYYAYSADTTEWYDGTNGITLNYTMEGEDQIEGEENSSLVFDEYGGSIYIKVKIKNVDKKDIGKITISPASPGGLLFGSVMTNQDTPVEISMTGIVKTALRFTDNNSGKKYQIPFNVYKELESISYNPDFKAAVPLTVAGGRSAVNLTKLAADTLSYTPGGDETNQQGVTFSIGSIGCYNNLNQYVPKYDAESLAELEYIELKETNNGVFVEIKDGGFYGADAYVIRVVAISIYHDGSEGKKLISTEMDIYIVDNIEKIGVPGVTFADSEVEPGTIEDKALGMNVVKIYENGGSYAKSTIDVDMQGVIDEETALYKEPVFTSDGSVQYSIGISVFDNGVYKQCNFDGEPDEDNSVGINGLYVKKEAQGANNNIYSYTFSIASHDTPKNSVKVFYELHGFNYSYSNLTDEDRNAETKDITVVKAKLPTAFIANDTETINDGETKEANILSTSYKDYEGLKLKLFANPTDQDNQVIRLEEYGDLLIMESGGETDGLLLNGETITIKFKDAFNGNSSSFKISTLVTPDYYNGDVVDEENCEYITATFKLNKLTTANRFAFADVKGVITTDTETYIDATKEDNVYVRVYYSSGQLTTSTIKLKSANDKVLFKNGRQDCLLDDTNVTYLGTQTEGNEKYNLYRVPLKAVGSSQTTQITVCVDEESVDISDTITVSSVYVMNADATIDVLVHSGNIKKFTTTEVDNGAFNFAIARGEDAKFIVRDSLGNTNTIKGVKINKGQEHIVANGFKGGLFNPSITDPNLPNIITIDTSSVEFATGVTELTQITDFTIEYFSVDEDGLISLVEGDMQIQVAVFNAVDTITRTIENSKIGFINPFYAPIASSRITFSSSSNGQAPSNSVLFWDNGNNQPIEVKGASQIMLQFADFEMIKNSGCITAVYNNGQGEVSLLDTNRNVLTSAVGANLLDGEISIQLIGEPGFEELTFNLKALRYGDDSNTSVNVPIEIKQVDKADRIEVDGDFVQTGENSRELQMSFMNTGADGVAVKSFEANIVFKDKTTDKIRFEDLQNAMTYVLYQYKLDDEGYPIYDQNGNPIYEHPEVNPFNITYEKVVPENGKNEEEHVVIRALKSNIGGLYRLVLVTKDSYNRLGEDPDDLILEETDFDTTYNITLRVSDGSKSAAYIIRSTEDLKAINNNLDKYFVLGANLGDDSDGPVDIEPLGIVDVNGNKILKPFIGGLNGQIPTIVDENEVKITSYSIKVNIKKTVSSDYGAVAGLFGNIGANGVVKNLDIIACFGNEFSSTESTGLKIGSLAAVNNGTITNVNITYCSSFGANSNEMLVRDSANTVDFGIVVGLNAGLISSSQVEALSTGMGGTLVVKSYLKNNNINIGGVAGRNEGTIAGKHKGKDGLNNFIFDVVADISVQNMNESPNNSTNYNVGGVVGCNENVVKEVLVGGGIQMSTPVNNGTQLGNIGGVAGISVSGSIKTATVLSLDVESKSINVNVAGIVGSSRTTEINNVKFVSAITTIAGEERVGFVSGYALVAGVAAVVEGEISSVEYATVESFVDYYDDGDGLEVFYSIRNGTETAGLVCESETVVLKSFVKANIEGVNIYTTTNDSDSDSYFIGKTSNANESKASVYSVVDGIIYKGETAQNIDINNYMIPAITESTSDWTNIYVSSDGELFEAATEYDKDAKYYYSTNGETFVLLKNIHISTSDWTNVYLLGGDGYEKVNTYDNSETYYSLNYAAWKVVALDLISGADWETRENYNVTTYQGVDVFLPYLLRTLEGGGKEPLLIVKPESINAEINQDYVVSTDSIYVKDYNYEKYLAIVKESVIVNFFKEGDAEFNTHLLYSDAAKEGILDVGILPEDAQGGFFYEIIGDGHNYAYINSTRKEIVFTKASGNIPVIVRVYSVFNPSVEVYVAIYAESLATSVGLNSNSIYVSQNPDCDYEINLYTGQNNKIIAIDAENRMGGESFSSLLEVKEFAKYLKVVQSSSAESSKLEINVDSYQNMTLKIKDDLDGDSLIVDNEYEILTFKLILDSEYFIYDLTNPANCPNVLNDVVIGEIKLKVNLYNSAKSISVNGSDAEVSTDDDITLTINLTTDYVDASQYELSPTKVETVESSFGEVYNVATSTDGIYISFNIIEGQEVVDELCETNGVEYFADLLDVKIISSLYKTENENKVIGYKYTIFIELKDERSYRHINDSIKFNIVAYAASNREVSNANSPVEILLQPTELNTLRMEHYVVKSLDFHTDYTEIVKNDVIQTEIIEPGGLGNVMMIYLEPSYSQVDSVSIECDEVFVPSLGRSVQVKFTQLALDYRNGKKAFTTLSADRANVQQGSKLELSLISEIDSSARDVYTGIICLLIQIEEAAIGLDETLEFKVTAKTAAHPEGVDRFTYLRTSYLPGTKMLYDEDRMVSVGDKSGYLIQKGTSNNEVSLEIYGYQFNSNPDFELAWDLPEGSSYSFVDPENLTIIKDISGTTYKITDYVSHYLIKDISDDNYDEFKDSYTLKVILNVAEDIPASFRFSATLDLTTKDGQIYTSSGENNTLLFYPTEYIINSVEVAGALNNKINIAIGKQESIDLIFKTDNADNDLTSAIYSNLLDYARALDSNQHLAFNKIASMFTYYKNGELLNFGSEHSEFEFSLKNDEIIAITGLEQFNSAVKFLLRFGYEHKSNGLFELRFNKESYVLSTTFTLNIYAIDEEKEILVYSAEDIYDSESHTWKLDEAANYVLMNDIELSNVKPITTNIRKFDGNNRVISIKSFSVNTDINEYGLFGRVGTYTTQDPETDQPVVGTTILRNIIVDYGKFEGTLALNNVENSKVVFGGLVAVNDGGLIYNCDVMNLGGNGIIDLIVKSNVNATVGGLVGQNNGIITNSRVGRSSYSKIIATRTTENVLEKRAEELTIRIFNRQNGDDDINKFESVVGGFVGINKGTIASSYVENTNIINHSTNETINKTAGFAGENSKIISYSYAKSKDSTLTSKNPYSTGTIIESVGNGMVAGFVYTNSGDIDNSYSNIELTTKSTYIAGFVYENTGKIATSYSASTMNAGAVSSFAEQPFVGVDNKGELLSFGTLENTYYLMRSDADEPYTDGEKDIAYPLNEENFQNNEYLIGFSFILSNNKAEREQGIWSYYTINSKKRVLPELMTATKIAHSHRYAIQTVNPETKLEETKLINTVSYAEGSQNNPYTISNVKEFNAVFTENSQMKDKFKGNVRLINNIDFNDDKTAIKTRANFSLGDNESSIKTSVEGNGMTISGIYLDAGEAVVDKIGLFAEVQNAYIKNLNLEFATPETDGQFSTFTTMYSGGLAGKIDNSAIVNVSIDGANTTLTGSNFVGGVAGLISGNSLVYGVETNINVKSLGEEGYLYYNEEAYKELHIQSATGYTYPNYLKHLSYAGGVAGVLDLTKRSYVDYNIQFVDVLGNQMLAKTFNNLPEANILGEYAGGVAGYASKDTNSFKLRYFIGESEIIRGDTAVGGLFAVGLGNLTACQVAGEVEDQYAIDKSIGDYITKLANNQNATITTEMNSNLLQGNNYVGGLIAVSLNNRIHASYSKATSLGGKVVGGLAGVMVAGSINYSYAVPFVNITEDLTSVGGLIGEDYAVLTRSQDRNNKVQQFIDLVEYYYGNDLKTDIQFTYSTLVIDESQLETLTIPQQNKSKSSAKFDYICADYDALNILSDAKLDFLYVYGGTIKYKNDIISVTHKTKDTNKASSIESHDLFNVGEAEQVITFQEVFSSWAVIKYWILNEDRFYPLLDHNVVDNFIIIDEGSDISLMRTNPNGKFKVVKDIVITELDSNWIVGGTFTGVLLGEHQSADRKPVIAISGLNPTVSETSSGFFQKTYNATISNLVFNWVSSESNPSVIDLDKFDVDNLTMVSGLTCEDENSLISNVEVVAQGYAFEGGYNGYIIHNTDKQIGGFGGIVGNSYNTNLLGCSFAGQVKANLASVKDQEIYFGGAIGFAQSKDNNNGVYNNIFVGAPALRSEEVNGIPYPQTSFELDIKSSNRPIYISGLISKADKIALAAASVGGLSYEANYKQVNMSIKLNSIKNDLFVGGMAGFVNEGLITNTASSMNISVVGSISAEAAAATQPMMRVGGMVGTYTGNATGVTNSDARTNISTSVDGQTLDSDVVTILAGGIAEMRLSTILKECVITGEINTKGSKIKELYSGAVVGRINSGASPVDIETITADVAQIIGSTATINLNVGGIAGHLNKAKISYVATMGRIAPTTGYNADMDVSVGGLFGKVEENVEINNSYTLSSIISSAMDAKSIAEDGVHISALVGSLPENSTSENIYFDKIFYSSDYAMYTDEDTVKKDSVDIKLGLNLSATTMLRNDVWHSALKTEEDSENDIWEEFIGADATNRIPYLASLKDMLIKHDILVKIPGTTAVDYAIGLAVCPYNIVSSTEFAEDFTYYLLADNNMQELKGALNGVLIGGEKEFVITSLNSELQFGGIVPIVKEQSAVSNLHLLIQNDVKTQVEISTQNTFGVVVGENSGSIFNCSVQGHLVKFTSGGNGGIVAGVNKGFISHCYSSVEVIDTKANVGGIVHTNEGGKLFANYFTGYIGCEEDGSGVTMAGIVNIVAGGFIYNNYMGGVVTSIGENGTAFAGEILAGDVALLNYIDKYSDIHYANKDFSEEDITEEEAQNAVNPIETAQLMANNGLLIGAWVTTVTDGEIITEGSKTFGYNYNYPIYNFNKSLSNDGGVTLTEVGITAYQNYTGTGNVDNSKDENLAIRYGELLKNSISYRDAFKIPHLGILTATHNLMETSRNYVLIYDINGMLDEENNINWTAIGTKDNNINGFKYSGKFNGVFISNKYQPFSEILPEEINATYCTVENLSKNGLFADINQAYIGNLTLGGFTRLENSGALGTNVAEAIVAEETSATINNVEFIENSIISSEKDCYGALFGSVAGKLDVYRVLFGEGDNAVELHGYKYDDKEKVFNNVACAGLIGGELLETGVISLNNSESYYAVKFVGNEFAGGLVGKMLGGEIYGSGNTIEILGNSDYEQITKNFGGIAGIITGSSIIKDLTINIAESVINAQSFGGIASRTLKDPDDPIQKIVGAENITISSSANIEFQGTEAERYYGLLVGLQELELQAKEVNIENIVELKMVCLEDGVAVFEENNETTGIGTFVGVSKANISVEHKDMAKIKLEVIGVPNLGGYIGYVNGSHNISFTGKAEFELRGTTNVGGFIGFLNGSIPTNNEGANSLISSTSPYSTIIIEGSESVSDKYKNFGGLIGRWLVTAQATTQVVNANNISVVEKGYAYNVGGVVGQLVASDSLSIGNLSNVGFIENEAFDLDRFDKVNNKINKEDDTNTCKLVNVGGVVGSVSEGVTLTNIISNSSGSILGYQNVGGLVGYAEDSVQIVNNPNKTFAGLNNIGCLDNDGSITYGGDTIHPSVTGIVYGVVNVGGAVGYAGKNTTISKVFSQANVYGNVNVGGVIGFGNIANLDSNAVVGYTQALEEKDGEGKEKLEYYGVVKGVYYNYHNRTIIDKEDGSREETEINRSFIPTSIGGLIGTSHNSTFTKNLLHEVVVTSATEGVVVNEDGEIANQDLNQVISTVSNFMANVKIGEGNNFESYINSLNIYDLDKIDTKLPFDKIESGYGGFAGTINSDSLTNIDEAKSNIMRDIKINAQLGVNVGTYYGAYIYKEGLTINDVRQILVAPTLHQTDEDVNITVDGAYNIGGVAGLVSGGEGLSGLSNTNLFGNATIDLQDNYGGFYIGGLFGRTNANTIAGLNLQSGKDVDIIIHTLDNYYIGGLIGRAEVATLRPASLVEINGTLGDWQSETIVDGSDNVVAAANDRVTDFGALIGMLKLGETPSGNITAKVSGYHKYAFTVNTIQNSNYYDGESRFNVVERNDETKLLTEAYYVNRDSFNIVGSNNELLYNGNLEDVEDGDGNVIDPADCNPINPLAKGWSKQYTGFKQIQRCIKQKHQEVEWDSITSIYNAENITHVGTIGNLGLWSDVGHLDGSGNLVEDGPDGVNDNKFRVGTDGETIVESSLDKDYICFTVYKTDKKEHILYSAMGIASLMFKKSDYYQDDDGEYVLDTNSGKMREKRSGDIIPELRFSKELGEYTTPRNTTNSLIVKLFANKQAPDEIRYIDMNADNKSLSYFEWGRDGEWTEHKTIDGSQTKYQCEAADAEGKIFIMKYASYFVENYLSMSDSTLPTYGGEKGVYFEFGVIFDNNSINGLKGKDSEKKDISTFGGDDANLPRSGLIFEANGIHTPHNEKVRLNVTNRPDGAWLWWVLGGLLVVGIVILSIVVPQVGGAILTGIKAVGKAISFVFKMIGKLITLALKGNMLAIGGLTLIGALIAGIVMATSQSDSAQLAYLNFVKPSELNYGFLSTTYNRKIVYSNGKLVNESDRVYEDEDGETYVYYSVTKPADYNLNEYVAMEVNYEMRDGKNIISDKNFADLGDRKLFITIAEHKFTEIMHDITVYDGSDKELKTSFTATIGVDKDGKYYLLNNKYEYKNGEYYINSKCGVAVANRVIAVPQLEEDAVEGVDFVQVNGGYYLTGIFADGVYNYSKSYNNKIEKSLNGYMVNGVSIENRIVEYSKNKINYVPQEDGEPITDGLGYKYMNRVYYAVAGKPSLAEIDVYRYATFSLVGKTAPEGIANVHYVSLLGADGETYYYKLKDVTFEEGQLGQLDGLPEGKTINGSGTVGEDDEIQLQVYPYAFSNPYAEYGYNNLGNLIYSDAKQWVASESGTSGISHSPTYYLFEGGYEFTSAGIENGKMKNGSLIYEMIDKNDLEGVAYEIRPIKNYDETVSDVNVEYDLGSIEVKTLKEIFDDWNKYKRYYIESCGFSVESMFKKGSDTLYELNFEKTLNENGLLSTLTWNDKSENALENIYQFMYLTNKDINLYTRYVYRKGAAILDLSGDDVWGDGYSLSPLKSNTTTTYLAETCRVILGGGYSGVKLAVDNSATSGTITVS